MPRNNNPAHYRAALPRALAMHRSGHTLQAIADALSGSAAWWDVLLHAAAEYRTDPIRDQIIDMRGAGFSIERIASEAGVSRRQVLHALSDEAASAYCFPSWEKETEAALLADYESGLTAPQLARKYGFSSGRVALAAVRRRKK